MDYLDNRFDVDVRRPDSGTTTGHTCTTTLPTRRPWIRVRYGSTCDDLQRE